MPKKELTKTDTGALFRGKTASEPAYLQRWADSHRSTFEDCMERLADELPQKYAELYIKIMTIQQPQPKQNKTDINTLNVNVNSKLDTLGAVKDTSWRNEGNSFTNYEEVNNEK